VLLGVLRRGHVQDAIDGFGIAYLRGFGGMGERHDVCLYRAGFGGRGGCSGWCWEFILFLLVLGEFSRGFLCLRKGCRFLFSQLCSV
jgi:hypothetical protein